MPRRGVNDALPGAFHNDTDPQYSLQKEKPVHRLMIEMSCEGATNKEIAAAFEVTTVSVSNILRQPWARRYMIAHQKSRVAAVGEMLDEALPAIMENLIRIATVDTRTGMSPEQAPSVIAAARECLDRRLGKANQNVTVSKRASEMSDEELKEFLISHAPAK